MSGTDLGVNLLGDTFAARNLLSFQEGVHDLHRGLAARALERVRAPDAEDEVTPKCAHGVRACFCPDEVLKLADGDFAGSGDFQAFRNLPEPEERLDQLALAADGHLGKAFEPFAVRDFGSCFQPSRKEFKLGDGNFPLVHAKPQTFEQCPGDAVPATPSHLDCRRRIHG